MRGGIRRTPAGDYVEITIVAAQRDKRFQAVAWHVSCRQIYCVISFTDIKCSAVNLNRSDTLSDERIGIGVAVAMGIGGQVVWE